MANPPFNDSAWGGEALRDDPRWKYGIPPASNSNYAWIEHFIYHLSPAGFAGFVMANSAMSANQGGEGDIRKALIEADLIDCVIALPRQLFYTTQIPVCIWIVARDRSNHKYLNRRGKVLFIDASNLGKMIDRTHRELTSEDTKRIANSYHAWRGEARPSRFAGK